MKRVLTLLLMVMIARGLSAQTDMQDNWTLKPMAGLTLSTLVGDDAPDCKSKLGWTAGVETEWQGKSRLGFSVGLQYVKSSVKEGNDWVGFSKEYGFSDDGNLNYRHHSYGDFSYRFHYLCMPLLLRLHVCKGLSLYTGVQPQLLLAAREGYTHETYEYLTVEKYGAKLSSASESSDIRDICTKFDASIPIGAAFDTGRLSFDIRYHFGLCRVEDYDPDLGVGYFSPYPWKLYQRQKDTWRCLMLTVGYRFHL